MNDIRRKSEDDKHQYYTDRLALTGQIADQRNQVAQTQQQLMMERLNNGLSSRQQEEARKSDEVQGNRAKAAEDRANRIMAGYTDMPPDAGTFSDYGIDPSDPHKKLLLREALLQDEYSKLPSSTKTWMQQQGMDLNPFDSLKGRFTQKKSDQSPTPPAPTTAGPGLASRFLSGLVGGSDTARPPATSSINSVGANVSDDSAPTDAPGASPRVQSPTTNTGRPVSSYRFNPQTGQLEPDDQ